MHSDAEDVRAKWAAGKPVVGPFVQIPAVGSIEIMALAGFDFVIVDLEHGAINTETAENMMRAAHARGVTPLVRVLANHPELIVSALNLGAAGVLVPHVSGYLAAQRAVSAMRFGPIGTRGVCPFVRAADYSANKGPQYYEQANETIAGVAIEGKEALAELDSILDIPTLDFVFIGPYDLSQSLGVTGETDHPNVVDAVRGACEMAVERGKRIGLFVEEIEAAARWVELGVRLVALDVDSQILFRASRAIVGQFNELAVARSGH